LSKHGSSLNDRFLFLLFWTWNSKPITIDMHTHMWECKQTYNSNRYLLLPPEIESHWSCKTGS
jgi:hypothetical protein